MGVSNVSNELARNDFYPDEIIADGKLKRFKRTPNHRRKDCWYVCYENLGPEIFYVIKYGDMHDQSTVFCYCSKNNLSEADTKLIQSTYLKIEEQIKEEKEKSLEKAKLIYELANGHGQNDYTTRKKIPTYHGVKSDLDNSGRTLYIPLYNSELEFVGLQKIYSEGAKYFVTGTQLKGSFFCIGEQKKESPHIYICEGFSTGASIQQAMDSLVVVAFSANNLKEVCLIFKSRFPDKTIVVCGDDDHWKNPEKNPGRKAAIEAAEAVKGKYVFPSFKHIDNGASDFNDLHLKESLEAVKEQIAIPVSETGFKIKGPKQILSYVRPEKFWLVKELMRYGGTSIFSAQAKAGKSTLVRQLIIDVARGGSFLGFQCEKNKVLYLAIDDSEDAASKHFQALGLTENDPVYMHVEDRPEDPMKELLAMVGDLKPGLIVIDTLGKFSALEDYNDYAEANKVCMEFSKLARKTQAHVCVIHHNKKGNLKGQDGILGSTGFAGNFEVLIGLNKDRESGDRSINVESRFDYQLPDTALVWDELTRRSSLGQAAYIAERENMDQKVLDLIRTNTEISLTQLRDQAAIGRGKLNETIDRLIQNNRILRSGTGTKKTPITFKPLI